MANLNINGSVYVGGSLTDNFLTPSGWKTITNYFAEIYDTGWKKIPGTTNTSSTKMLYRIKNSICFVHLASYGGFTLPLYNASHTKADVKVCTMPLICSPDNEISWIANPVDYSGFAVQLRLNTAGEFHGCTLGGSSAKSYWSFFASYPLTFERGDVANI